MLEHVPEPPKAAAVDNDINAKTTSVLGAAEPTTIPEYKAVRTESALYVEYVTGEREFYTLENDPDELRNGASTMTAAARNAWHQYLGALSTCVAQACLAAEARVPPV